MLVSAKYICMYKIHLLRSSNKIQFEYFSEGNEIFYGQVPILSTLYQLHQKIQTKHWHIQVRLSQALFLL